MLRIILNIKKYFFQRFNQKVQERPSISSKNINCSRTNAAYNESRITTISRATQHAGNILDSHSATTLSIHNEMLFFSGALGALEAEGASGSASSSLKLTIILTPGSASSRLNETLITGSDRMMLLPREDALLTSSLKSFSQRMTILKKMMKIQGMYDFFIFFFFNYFTHDVIYQLLFLNFKVPDTILLFHFPLHSVYFNRQIDRWH